MTLHIRSQVSLTFGTFINGQGKPRFIISANLVGLTSLMLHTKSQVICLLVPEKKIFKGFLPYMGVVTILVM